MQNILEVNNLNFGYDEKVTLFDNFSFNVNDKEKIKISGKNGTGKSTLFNILTGVYSQNKIDADIRYKGKSILPFDLSKHVSYISVDNQIFKGLSATENIELFSRLFGEDSSYTAKVFDKCRKLGLSETDLNKKCIVYSSGMSQKLWLALMLSRNIDLYFLDEPFRTLDKESLKVVVQTINELHSPVLIVIHEEIKNLKIDRIISIEKK